ncbi:Tetratricopeptide TPR_1 repeat-containing protein [Pseudopedobacter saltans DSM 12145]|uniref:Tetratricopeptide TPR_1 repeat-containing protein n=1 Tax=Pseudopedobacter saltans (strain ATCC 51119 / DSM 12145 / JCM 21818 / CCUG 39354 / LMG 10337 / NBRC 100064 / NCIMB 13643) TaxID=762903 RepID=F0SBQ2_PSESL|nr:tetratricopeptide repeat protein [Pseudopedobacter saltans]ADY52743.1 Tetratricopeptide TPR_1 repeat-containing protein [Pseudopedobacter saltans DSM 12145]
MKKRSYSIFIVLLFGALHLKAQTAFQFNTRFYDAIDKWVVFPKSDKDSLYSFGFIYLDVMAGPTFQYEGRIDARGKELQKIVEDLNTKTSIFKYRLGPNTNVIHVLSDSETKQLDLKPEPDWLAIYKADKISYQAALGSMYNANGKPDTALDILTKAYNEDKKNEKLLFELAYSYNALKRYNDAINVLSDALKVQPNNGLFYKELVYAYTKADKLDKAEKVYKDFKDKAGDKAYIYETAYNLAYSYYVKADKEGFEKWATEVGKSNQAQFVKNIEAMRQNWGKQ